MSTFEITPLNVLSKYLQRLTEAKLWTKVIIGLLAGVAVGALLHPDAGIVTASVSESVGDWLALPGNLFLKLVQMIMIPLIFSSIITGIVSNAGDQLKSMGVKLVVYFVITTTIAISIGTVLAMWLKPGSIIFERKAFEMDPAHVGTSGSEGFAFNDIPRAISELIPENPLAAMVTGEMLGVVIFTVIVGIAITRLSSKTLAPISKLLHAIQEICMTIVSWAMLLVPIAVFGLIAQLVSSIGIDGLTGIGYFMATVLAGLVLMMVVYLILASVLGRTNPWHFLKSIREVQLLAFSTTSSAAVMPLSMKTADEKLGVSSKVSDFVIPIGATINMDGTALFQCVAALFIAQAYGMDMSIVSVLLIMVTVVAASIGTPAIPGGGVVVLASVLQSAGIPAEGIMIIIGVERILGMFRTAVNVTGDLTACVVFERLFPSKAESPIPEPV